MTTTFLEVARRRTGWMHERLRDLVECESPSDDPDALRACSELISHQWVEATGRSPNDAEAGHLLWEGQGTPEVLLLGHYDTVWPLGTIEELPFTITNGIIGGPGVLDMKAGIIQILTAITLLGNAAEHVVVLLTADEETGSTTSRPLIEQTARRAGTVLVCEPAAPDGAVKIARRGVAHYRVTATGRAAHAGEEPEQGLNAGVEIALQIPAILALTSTQHDTTVTPTVLRAGTTINSIPESGHVDVDVRAWTKTELERVDEEIRLLQPHIHGTGLAVSGGIDRQPFEPDLTTRLTRALAAGATDLGLQPPATIKWRSASDANITAGIGIPTLDGLGAVGAHPHARTEHVIAATLPDRAALLAALIHRLITG